jgi:hypothetical protein
MHGAKHEHDHADLATDRFEHFANICRSDALLQGKRYVADIDKIKPYDKEVIDRIGQSFVAAERINQKTRPFLCSVCATQMVSGMLSAM